MGSLLVGIPVKEIAGWWECVNLIQFVFLKCPVLLMFLHSALSTGCTSSSFPSGQNLDCTSLCNLSQGVCCFDYALWVRLGKAWVWVVETCTPWANSSPIPMITHGAFSGQTYVNNAPNSLFRWRVCFLVSIIPATILCLSMSFCAESPHWLYKVCFHKLFAVFCC